MHSLLIQAQTWAFQPRPLQHIRSCFYACLLGNERKDIFLLGMRKRDKFASQQLELIDGYVVAMRRVWNWLVRYPYFKTRALCLQYRAKVTERNFDEFFPFVSLRFRRKASTHENLKNEISRDLAVAKIRVSEVSRYFAVSSQ